MVIARVRKRIAALEGLRLEGVNAAIHELWTVRDLLVRCRGYIANVSSKLHH